MLLDTHIWLWWLLGSSLLSLKDRNFLDNLATTDRPLLASISLWELEMLVRKKRLELDMPLDRFLESAVHPNTVKLVSITPAVILKMAELPDSFHLDPADRLITATSMALDVPLWTQDRLIRKFKNIKLWKHQK